MTTEEIALQVAKEWQMAFGGVELDFALEVAKRAVESEREACAKYVELVRDDWVRAGDNKKACSADYLAHAIRTRPNAIVSREREAGTTERGD